MSRIAPAPSPSRGPHKKPIATAEPDAGQSMRLGASNGTSIDGCLRRLSCRPKALADRLELSFRDGFGRFGR
jgi:hypothetical protein